MTHMSEFDRINQNVHLNKKAEVLVINGRKFCANKLFPLFLEENAPSFLLKALN